MHFHFSINLSGLSVFAHLHYQQRLENNSKSNYLHYPNLKLIRMGQKSDPARGTSSSRVGLGLSRQGIQQMARCIECGLLAIREAKTGALCEADENQRRYKEVRQLNGWEVYHRIPICIEGVVDFCAELKETPDAVIKSDRILALTEQSRECNKFTPYRPGRTPQWHQDKNTEMEIERMRDAQRDKERQWQDEQKDSDRKWQEEQAKLNRRWQLKLAILAAIFSLITGAIGIWLGKTMNLPTQQIPVISRDGPFSK